jgi:hypothetical protein
MTSDVSDQREIDLIRGDFVTDGTTFVLRLAGTPFSGVGHSAAAAFEDLIRIDREAAPLSDRLRELARDQQGEKVRSTMIRTAMIGLIVFGVIGGALFGAAAMLPRVLADVSETTITQLARWIEDMPADKQERLSRAIARIGVLSSRPTNCPANPSSDLGR